MSTNIYALYDSRIPDLPFYVGKGLARRAQSHWKTFQRKGTAVSARLRYWFESLRRDGAEATWQFLEENVSNWQDAEREWIAAARRVNGQLCNVFDGGDGWSEIPGWKIAQKVHPEMARQSGLKADRATNGWGKANKLHPELGRKGGTRTKQLHPNLSRDTVLKTHALYPDMARRAGKKGGPIACHNRWHVKRGIVNPNCDLCRNA